jgi:pimeloyl-ACP methyl ester carboxylesterase
MKVVFVHGALVFDGAWWWHRMVEPLAALGLGTRTVELPSCVPSPGASGGEAPGDMYADADAVRAALEEEDEPLVLVGHSYGGMVITDAAAGHANAEHLVYVTSVMPELDEPLSSFGGGREPGPWMDPRPEDGTMGVKAELLPGAFMQDCDEAAVAGASAPGGLRANPPRRRVAREALDLRRVRRGPGDPSRGAEGVREEGGSRGGASDRPPPDALAAGAAGPDARGGGRHAGRVRSRDPGASPGSVATPPT